ncbi:MAG: hypothetical protein AAGC92_07310 [Pseudomonadota bacterium]
MSGKLEKRTIKLEISPFAEMNRQTERWCLDNKALKKALRPIVFSEKAEIDTRRWDMKDLEEGLTAMARYDLKVFDVAVIEARKQIDKAKPRDAADVLAKAEKDIIALHGKTEKHLLRKLSRALDDVAGGPDNEKALSDGKAALDRIEDLDLELVFKDIAQQAAEALSGVVAKAKKLKQGARARAVAAGTAFDERDEANYDMVYRKGSDRSFFDLAKTLDGLSKEIRGVAKETNAAINFLGKIGKKIKSDKKSSEEMNAYGKKIIDAKPAFEKYSAAVDTFADQLAELIKRAKDKAIKPSEVEVLARLITRQSVGIKAAATVGSAAKELARGLKTLEKKLR